MSTNTANRPAITEPVAADTAVQAPPLSTITEEMARSLFLTDAEKLVADGLTQPPSLAGTVSSDTAFRTLAQRMKADGLR